MGNLDHARFHLPVGAVGARCGFADRGVLPMHADRIEVKFFVDHIEFSCFTGHEGVETDERILLDLISKCGD